MTSEKRDVYQEVTDRIVAAIEGGSPPWRRPWREGEGRSGDGRPSWWPRNAVTGRPYSGMNVWLLTMMGGSDPRFATYNQAKKAGGQVRKGEKGIPVILWRFVPDKTDPKKTIPVIRSFTVFNVSQIDSADPCVPVRWKSVETVQENGADWKKVRVSEAIKAVGVRVEYGGSQAFFSPAHDRVVVPTIDSFDTEDDAAATLLHELVHATGHSSRLNRDLANRFGDAAYAMEELVAEIGAAYLCADTGVAGSVTNHASYVNSWLKVLKNDKRAIFTASKAAATAADWIAERAGWRSAEEDGEEEE